MLTGKSQKEFPIRVETLTIENQTIRESSTTKLMLTQENRKNIVLMKKKIVCEQIASLKNQDKKKSR